MTGSTRTRRSRHGGWIWALAAAIAATGAHAVSTTNPANVVQAIADCRRLTPATDRLACYDKAADALQTAQTQGDVVVVDRAQVRAVRRQTFGFVVPSLNLFAHAGREEAVDHVVAMLARVGRTPDGKWAMTTDEDAVWLQTDSQDPYPEPRAGAKLTVRKGALGGFFCSVDGRPSMRCKRQS